jgi:hypothetical protein
LVVYALAKVGELVDDDFVTVGFVLSLSMAMLGAAIAEVIGRLRKRRARP